jgi:hypothetical protein
MTSYPTAVLNSVENFERRFKERAERKPPNDIAQDASRFDGSYKDYLNSDYWRAVRSKVMVRDKSACTICGSRDRVSVHHLHYDSVRNELQDLDSVTTLCSSCHAAEHELKTESRVGTIGSRDRILYLVSQWAKFGTHKVTEAKLASGQKLEVSIKWHQVTVNGKSFRVNPSDPLSVEQLWPYVAELFQRRQNFSSITLNVVRPDKVFYEIDGDRVGRSMTEAVLYWHNAYYLEKQRRKEALALRLEQEKIEAENLKAEIAVMKIAEAERVRASIPFIDEIGSPLWNRQIQSFLLDSPKTNPELRALWFLLKGIPEECSKLPYTEPFNNALSLGVFHGRWKRVRQGLYCSLNYMGS